MKKIVNNRVYISSQKHLMKEWAFEKNKGKDPTKYLIDSDERVWWKCPKGHLWEDTIKNRINGSKCYGCMTRNVIPGFNDLKTTASCKPADGVGVGVGVTSPAYCAISASNLLKLTASLYAVLLYKSA